jgi:hypothetical protein
MKANRLVKLAGYPCLIMALHLSLGCVTSAPITVPLPEIDTPELSGSSGKASFGARTTSAYRLSLFGDAARRPPNLDPGSLNHDSAGNAKAPNDLATGIFGGINFAKRFLVTGGISNSIARIFSNSGGGAFAKLQYQVLGDVYADSQPGNVSVLISLGGGYNKSEESGDQKDTFGAGGYPWKTESTATTILTGLSVGIRVSPNVLIFTGGGIGMGFAESSLTQEPAGDGSDNGYDIKTGRKGVNTSNIGLGIDVSTRHHHFVPRVGLSTLRFGSESRSDTSYGFEWRWDIGGGRTTQN